MSRQAAKIGKQLGFSNTIMPRYPRDLSTNKNPVANSAPRAFILDFDGTITTKDTISTIARYAISWHYCRGRDFQPTWNDMVFKYGEDFSKHMKQYQPVKEDRRTLKEEIDYYRSFKPIETGSFERISSSGIFKGITTSNVPNGSEGWYDFGAEAVKNRGVVVRKGFSEFVEALAGKKCLSGVVSVNFSRDFVGGVLSTTKFHSEHTYVVANYPNKAGILEGGGIFNGWRPGRVITTSDDKLAAMKEVLQSWRSIGVMGGILTPVYIGDSGTDIECLMDDEVIGIIIAEDGQSGLMESLNRVGVKVVHISQFLETGDKSTYWARNFTEIIESPLIMKFS